ncbi:MAG TPA: hypothetical protein VFY18_14700 [Candidatus Limnocylindrales bacterium]|nr:hypothetical protein [Candidatus Limnocylindrales bacterium]
MTDAPTPSSPVALTGATRRLVVAVVVAIAVLLVAVVAAMVVGGPGRRVETGIVVLVQSTGLSSVQGFSIRTADGRTVDFRVGTLENGSAFPPGHLAEHRVSLVPIRVTYVDRDGGHVAVRLEDAP